MKIVKLIPFLYTGGQAEPIAKNGVDSSEGNHIEDATTKQLYILLCSEKALYVYSLTHAVQVMHDLLVAISRNHE